jgi:hypothetical protein
MRALLNEIIEILHRIERNMLTAQTITDLINALNTALLAEANDTKALTDAQATIATMTANDASLNDPVLQASIDTALKNAVAANPPAPVVPPVTPPVTPPVVPPVVPPVEPPVVLPDPVPEPTPTPAPPTPQSGSNP